MRILPKPVSVIRVKHNRDTDSFCLLYPVEQCRSVLAGCCGNSDTAKIQEVEFFEIQFVANGRDEFLIG